jgi:hypothetical protein
MATWCAMFSSLNDRVDELLADLAHECMASSQHPFVAGSIADVECGRDGAVGTDAMPHPYGFAHLALRALVYSAGERVESTRLLMYRDPPHVLSVHDTARPAAEAAATAAWLGHPRADGPRRLNRFVGLVAESSQYETQLRDALGLTTGSMYEHNVLAWAAEEGIDGERVGLAERVRQAATHRGHADYKRLTNVTHNALWAVVAGWQEVVAAQDGHVEPIWAHAMLAALATCPYVLAGVEAADRVAGQRDSQHDALQQRVAALEDEVHSLADATAWPDLGNPPAT